MEARVGGKTAEDVFHDPQTLALVTAACDGNVAKIEALTKQGANVNATGYRDMTPLFWAMACKNYAGIEKLLELGADPNYKMEDDISAMWASAGSDDPHFLPLMLAHGGDPNIRSGYQSALMIAMEQNRKQNFYLLLEHGADVNQVTEADNTVATYAAALNKFDVVADLLRHGYTHNLRFLRRMVQISVILPDSEEGKAKDKVVQMLEARGVKFPVPPMLNTPTSH